MHQVTRKTSFSSESLIWKTQYTLLCNVSEAYTCIRSGLMCNTIINTSILDDVMKWKHFPRYWPFVRVIHRSPVNSPHKGQWRGALMFSLICAHYDVIVMTFCLVIVAVGIVIVQSDLTDEYLSRLYPNLSIYLQRPTLFNLFLLGTKRIKWYHFYWSGFGITSNRIGIVRVGLCLSLMYKSRITCQQKCMLTFPSNTMESS